MSNGARTLGQRRVAASKSVPVVLIGFSGLAKEGLQQVLVKSNYRVVAAAASLDQLSPVNAAKARLTIINEPLVEQGLAETVAALCAGDAEMRIVLFVDPSRSEAIAEAMRIPAHAFLNHNVGCEPLVKTLDVVLSGCAVLSPDILAHLLSRAAEPEARPVSEIAARPVAVGTSRPLSDREVDILRCLTDGSSNKLIARRFDIAESTVKIHVKGILRKINVQNRTQAAIWALAYMPPLAAMASAMPDAQPSVN